MTPKDWKYVELGSVIRHKKGYAFNSAAYRDSGTRIIRISDTTRNSIHNENPVYISHELAHKLGDYALNFGDILLSTVGSRPHLLDSMVGKAVEVPVSAAGSLLNQNLVKLEPIEQKITASFLFSALKKPEFIDYISTLTRGNANQVSITLSDLFKFKLLLPPLAEQTRIAQILSTWDKAIATTERLLANSQQQKQALMQQLLTGQKRFSGFADKWHEKSLKQLCKVSKGLQRNRDTLSADDIYPVINGGITPSGYTDAYNTEANTVTISEGGNSCGFVSLLSTRFWCGGHCYALLNPEVPAEFLYQLLKFNEPHIMRLRVGSGLPNIQKKALEGLTVLLPSNQAEQQKIAQVLSTADAEISNLQAQLAKLKLEKKALMQQLLTGQRHVKPDADAAV